jgi:hypothetical protein
MKTLITVLLIMAIGCSTAPLVKQKIPNHFQYVPQEVKIKIEGVDAVKV